MERFKIIIRLLSDLCVSDGNTYNSAIDIDVCHDEYGVPYIPARRIKGCLRECAIELRDMGLDIDIEGMFGRKDDNSISIKIENAYPVGYDVIKHIVSRNRDLAIFHQQNVMKSFTYIRTFTDIDHNNIAIAKGLRTMRVVGRGIEFEADIRAKSIHKDMLYKCCKLFKSLGMARTRGFGEIEVELIETKQDTSEKNSICQGESGDRIDYAMYLCEPVICTGFNGIKTSTSDYIEGGKVLGMLVQLMKDADIPVYEILKNNGLFCSNAYIDISGTRGVEVPAYVYSIKNDNGKYINKLKSGIEELDSKNQLNVMKHCYICTDKTDSIIRQNVNTEQRYHHKRPDDKAIGFVKNVSAGKGGFFNVESICKGQIFRGYITGSTEQITRISKVFKRNSVGNIGSLKTAEYGKVKITECFTSTTEKKMLEISDGFVVKLESATIVYNDKGMYSTDVNELKAEIGALLHINEEEWDIEPYVNYGTAGGFNVTWGMRKDIVDVFEKGTALYYKRKISNEIKSVSNIYIELPSNLYIGERNTEGYGEVSIYKIDEIATHGKVYDNKCESMLEHDKLLPNDNEFIKRIADNLFMDYLDEEALSFAANYTKNQKNSDIPLMTKLSQLCDECSDFAEIKKAIDIKFKGDRVRKNRADMLIRDIETIDVEKSFCEHNRLSQYSYMEYSQ